MSTESTNASVGRIVTRDIDEFQQFAAPWDVILRQMSPGVFHGRTEYLQVNGILLYREHCSHRIMATGSTPAGFFLFGGPASSRTRVSWCGAELNARCLAFGRPSSGVDFVIPAGSDHLVLYQRARSLRRRLQADVRRIPVDDAQTLRPVAPETAGRYAARIDEPLSADC